MTSLAVQRQLGVDQPDFGVLFDDMEYLDGDDVPMDRLLQPKIEAEVAFVVGRDLDDHAPSYSRVVSSLAYALPALEIVDSAIADWRITLEDTVADNASCGAYVLGHQPVSLGRLSLGARHDDDQARRRRLDRRRCSLPWPSVARGLLARSYDGASWTGPA